MATLYSTDGARSRAPPTRGIAADGVHRDDDSKAPRRVRRRTPCALVLSVLAGLSLVAAACVAYWLYPPLVKAWRNERSPEHPSELTFPTGVAQGPCVLVGVALVRGALGRAPTRRRPPPSTGRGNRSRRCTTRRAAS